MSDFLRTAADASAARCRKAERNAPMATLTVTPQPQVQFDPGGFHLIAEVKRHSPAEGALGSDDTSVEHIAQVYAQGGVAAVSVLTEPDRFSGSLDDLARVSRSIAAPVMRKDFLVHPYQIYEAHHHGARGALVIAGIGTQQHRPMIDAAAHTNTFVLLEAFNRHDLDTAMALADYADTVNVTTLLGINCRNLNNLQVELSRFEDLAPHLPPDRPVIAESGMHTADDVRYVTTLGYRGVLVGTALMRADHPAALLAEMTAAGVAGVTSCA